MPLLGPSPIEAPAESETSFSSFPPWPGNYPNLPSSCAPAPAPHWLRPPLWLHYQCWDSLMVPRPHCAGCWQRQTRGKGKAGEGEGGGEGGTEERRKKLDTKEQRAALKVNISITRDNTLDSAGFPSLKSGGLWVQDEAAGRNSVREEARRAAKGQQHQKVHVCLT